MCIKVFAGIDLLMIDFKKLRKLQKAFKDVQRKLEKKVGGQATTNSMKNLCIYPIHVPW